MLAFQTKEVSSLRRNIFYAHKFEKLPTWEQRGGRKCLTTCTPARVCNVDGKVFLHGHREGAGHVESGGAESGTLSNSHAVRMHDGTQHSQGDCRAALSSGMLNGSNTGCCLLPKTQACQYCPVSEHTQNRSRPGRQGGLVQSCCLREGLLGSGKTSGEASGMSGQELRPKPQGQERV